MDLGHLRLPRLLLDTKPLLFPRGNPSGMFVPALSAEMFQKPNPMSQEQWTSSLRLSRKRQSLQTCAAIFFSSSAFSGVVFTIEGMRRLTASTVNDNDFLSDEL
jgi:hypothetical protein